LDKSVSGYEAMKVNCQDHRASMQLLALKKRLEEGIADPEDEQDVKEIINKLEKALGLE